MCDELFFVANIGKNLLWQTWQKVFEKPAGYQIEKLQLVKIL